MNLFSALPSSKIEHVLVMTAAVCPNYFISWVFEWTLGTAPLETTLKLESYAV